jgi:C4-dicarboxylate-specific signal transduction histidine kinase
MKYLPEFKKTCEEEIRQHANNMENIVKERTDELREKDTQLVQSGKLATLGEMATGIAHEINQPLGSISLMVQGLQMAKKRDKLNDDLLTEKLSSIIDQIDRINKIITHLRTFGRQSGNSNHEVTVNGPLIDVFKLIGQQLKNKNITIETYLTEDVPPVLADNNKLEQVFLNIISNARDALEEYEQVIDKIRKSENPPAWANSWSKKIILRTYTRERFVFIEIADNAGGIPKSIVNKIFEPFFTTKEVGKGTGLGLSISYGIIKDFGGTIEVESEEDEGSKFIVKLPVHKNFTANLNRGGF